MTDSKPKSMTLEAASALYRKLRPFLRVRFMWGGEREMFKECHHRKSMRSFGNGRSAPGYLIWRDPGNDVHPTFSQFLDAYDIEVER